MSPTSYPDALRLLLDAITPIGLETIPINNALNRITATRVIAPQPLPNSRRSAVDGFALAAPDRDSWRVSGSRAAGELATHPLAEDEALAVMTGGGVPANATRVVRVEHTNRFGDSLQLSDIVGNETNINEIGNELHAGDSLLDKGLRITPLRHSILCYAGVSELAVYRPLRIGVMLSGPELLPAGSPARPGANHECHRALLQPILDQLACQYTFIGPVKDDPQTIRDTIEQLAEEHDLIVTSGGVSMGKYDFVRPLLHQQEFDLILDRTKIKPGRPLLAARRDGKLFMAMPGYPAAFLVNLCLYLLPVIKRMSGCRHSSTLWQNEVAGATFSGRAGRSDLIRIRRHGDTVRPLDTQFTSHYAGFGQADGLAWLDESRAHAHSGENINVCWFDALLNEGRP